MAETLEERVAQTYMNTLDVVAKEMEVTKLIVDKLSKPQNRTPEALLRLTQLFAALGSFRIGYHELEDMGLVKE